jgi:hypothetical protein
MSEDELLQVVWRTARRGNVAAMRLAWHILKAKRPRDETDSLRAVDELAERRLGQGRWASSA